MRGQEGTERHCLKAQELISGVGQVMTVGTFGPMEWGAVVGLITHYAVNTVQRYLWLYERGTVPRSRQQWRTVCDRRIILQSGRSDAQNAHQHAAQSIMNTLIQESQEDDENVPQKLNKNHRAMKTTTCQACDHNIGRILGAGGGGLCGRLADRDTRKKVQRERASTKIV